MNKDGSIRGEHGGSWSSRARPLMIGDVRIDETAAELDAGSNTLELSSFSAATTAVTNMEILEQTNGKGSDRLLEMIFNADGKVAGALKINSRVRENMIDEKWHGSDGERRQRANKSRKEEEALEAAVPDVELIIISLTMQELQNASLKTIRK
jgi:hypothetical protein